MKLKRILSCLLVCYGFSNAFAQERLSLSDAIQRSLANNYDILLERKKIDKTKLNNSWGEAGRYPTIDLVLGQNNSLRNIGDNPAAFVTGDIINRSVDPRVNINWTFFNGFKANITKKRLENLQKDSEGNAAIIIENTVQAVILGYYQAVLQQERLSVLKKVMALSKDRYDYAKVRQETGLILSVDVALEESNYLTDSINYINQTVTFRNAVRDLNVLLAEDSVNKPYNLTDQLTFSPKEYNLLELNNKLNANNVNLKRQFLLQEIAKNDISLAKAAMMPQASVSGSIFNNRSRQDLTNAIFSNGRKGPDKPNDAVTTTYSLNFSVSFRLFNGGKIRRAIQRSKIDLDMGNLRIEKLQQSLNKDLSAAFDLYNVRKQLLEIASQNKRITEKNLQIFSERLKTGLINSFDYRNVQSRFINASYNELQAIFSLIESNTNLTRLTGGILDE